MIPSSLVLTSRTVGNDLWRNVRRTTTEGGRQLSCPFVLKQRSKTEIRYLQIAIAGQEHILRLDVSMTHTFRVHEAHGADQLRKVDMSNILADTLISLDLIEEIPTLGQLHCNPTPYVVFASLVEVDDIAMTRDMPVHCHFQLKLSCANLSVACGVIFVNVLDCEDGIVRI